VSMSAPIACQRTVKSAADCSQPWFLGKESIEGFQFGLALSTCGPLAF
jgi:hypothetical protein